MIRKQESKEFDFPKFSAGPGSVVIRGGALCGIQCVGFALRPFFAAVPQRGANRRRSGGLCWGACGKRVLGAVASSALGPAHCCKVVACCQWTSGTQNPARLFALGL